MLREQIHPPRLRKMIFELEIPRIDETAGSFGVVRAISTSGAVDAMRSGSKTKSPERLVFWSLTG
jgi:hypothetical protein